MSEEKRTISQNASLHLFCTQVAEALRDSGQTMKDVVKLYDKIEIEPTPENVKEMIWRPIQIALYGKKSTVDLTTEEVSTVYNNVSRFLTMMQISIPFPSVETLIEKE